jgi:hypothetical protein
LPPGKLILRLLLASIPSFKLRLAWQLLKSAL